MNGYLTRNTSTRLYLPAGYIPLIKEPEPINGYLTQNNSTTIVGANTQYHLGSGQPMPNAGTKILEFNGIPLLDYQGQPIEIYGTNENGFKFQLYFDKELKESANLYYAYKQEGALGVFTGEYFVNESNELVSLELHTPGGYYYKETYPSKLWVSAKACRYDENNIYHSYVIPEFFEVPKPATNNNTDNQNPTSNTTTKNNGLVWIGLIILLLIANKKGK